MLSFTIFLILFLPILLGIGHLLLLLLHHVGSGRLFHLLRVELLAIVRLLLLLLQLCVLLRAGRHFVRVLFQEEGHGPGEQFEGDEVLLVTLPARLQQLLQLLISWVDLHVSEERLEAFRIYKCLTHADSLKGSFKIHKLLCCEHLLDRNVLHTEVSPILLRLLHGFLEDTCWVGQTQLGHTW